MSRKRILWRTYTYSDDVRSINNSNICTNSMGLPFFMSPLMLQSPPKAPELLTMYTRSPFNNGTRHCRGWLPSRVIPIIIMGAWPYFRIGCAWRLYRNEWEILFYGGGQQRVPSCHSIRMSCCLALSCSCPPLDPDTLYITGTMVSGGPFF